MATKTQLSKIEKIANAFGFIGKYNAQNAWTKIGKHYPFAFFIDPCSSAELYVAAERQGFTMELTDCNGMVIDWDDFKNPTQFVSIMANAINK